MNTSIRLFSKLLLILLLSFQFTFAMANTGEAFSVKGTAAINGSELNKGDSVKQGDIIKTGANSSVKIIMKDRTVLDINENTRFQISKYSYNKDNPAKSKSSFALLKGTFRYISGLIAKNKPQNVQISAGTATIGIRGTFNTISFDGTNINVDSTIGTATITFANGDTVSVNRGNTGTVNVATGQSSVTTTSSPNPVAAAAAAIAANPGDSAAVLAALSGLSAADATIVMAALISNASQYGMSQTDLTAAAGNIAAAKPASAAALSFVASALSPDNSQSYINAIQTGSGASQSDSRTIQDAGDSGTATGSGGGGGGGGGAGYGNP